MAAKGRVMKVLLVALLVLGAVSPGAGNAKEFSEVRGIVNYVNGDVLTIGRTQYDISGVPVMNVNGTAAERGEALRGKMAVIRYRNGEIRSVTVSIPAKI